MYTGKDQRNAVLVVNTNMEKGRWGTVALITVPEGPCPPPAIILIGAKGTPVPPDVQAAFPGAFIIYQPSGWMDDDVWAAVTDWLLAIRAEAFGLVADNRQPPLAGCRSQVPRAGL